jgi:UTP--glucose-1-phosphate uridylyltransferase
MDDDLQQILDAYGFDEPTFTKLRTAVGNGSLSATSNVVTGSVEPPLPSDLLVLPEPGDPTLAAAHDAGLAALRAGEVASIILNGGMATRFGGRVKGVVEAVDGRSFLEIKLGQAAALATTLGAPVPCVLMTSFATDAPTKAFLADVDVPTPRYFSQYVSLRLEADGSLFLGAGGRPSLYAPGHGDFLTAFRASGTLADLRSGGVRYVMVSNVDNLPARLDPVVLGSHILAGRPMTAEVATNTGDVGGAPARIDGHVQLLESMRFPAGFDHSSLPVTNVNTVTFSIDALDRDFDLTWLYIVKSVEGRKAVQLEHLFHEASSFLPTTFLVVPLDGPRSRFLPVKTPADLEEAQERLRSLLERPILD